MKHGVSTARGRFRGNKPKQAASKALSSLLEELREQKKSVSGEHHFTIVECTRGSRCKEYHYTGERVELDEPMEIHIGKGKDRKTITYRYNNKVYKDTSKSNKA